MNTPLKKRKKKLNENNRICEKNVNHIDSIYKYVF